MCGLEDLDSVWLDKCLQSVVMAMGGQTGCGTMSYINRNENGSRIERTGQGKQGAMAQFVAVRGLRRERGRGRGGLWWWSYSVCVFCLL